MAGIAILRKLLLKEAAKGSGQASGILSIGDSVRKIADNKLQSYLLSAQKQGVDIDKMGENEIKYMLEMNKPKNKMKVVSQDNPEFKDIMDAMMGKKKDNVIEGKFGKSFKESIKRDIIRDINNMETIPSMKEMNKVIKREGKYSNLTDEDVDEIFKATEDRTAGRLDEVDPEDMYADGGRTGFFLGSKSPKGAALFRQLLKFMDTRGGDETKKSPLQLLKRFNPKQYKKLLEDPLLYTKGREGIMASDAVKKGADEAREARIVMTDQILDTAKKLQKSDKNIEARNKEMIQAAIEAGVPPDQAENYVRSITQSMLKATKMDAPKPSDEGILQLEQILKNLKTEGKTKRDLNADGGRIGLKGGADAATASFSKSAGSSAKGRTGSVNVGAGGATFNPGGRDDPVDDRSTFEQTMNQRNIVDRSKKPKESILKNIYDTGQDVSYLRNLIMGNFPGIARQLMFEYGRKKLFDDQSMLNQEGIVNSLPENQFAELTDMQKKMLEGPQKNLKDIMGISNEEILKNIEKFNNPDAPATIEDIEKFYQQAKDGGRIGFKKGMDRRTFMKIMGGFTTLPILGKFFKGAEVATKAATKVPFESATRSAPPTYFIELINKIKLNGKKSKVGPSDRVDEYSYTGKNGDEYTLTEDITTGDAQIRKDKIGGRSYEEGSYDVIEDRTVMEYKAPR